MYWMEVLPLYLIREIIIIYGSVLDVVGGNF